MPWEFFLFLKYEGPTERKLRRIWEDSNKKTQEENSHLELNMKLTTEGEASASSNILSHVEVAYTVFLNKYWK